MDELMTLLGKIKADLDTAATQAEILSEGDEIRSEDFNGYNNLIIYLQECRRSLRSAINMAKEI